LVGGPPAIFVTLFGWAALIKGIIILFLPPEGADISPLCIMNDTYIDTLSA
jgi:hypothetical protein